MIRKSYPILNSSSFSTLPIPNNNNNNDFNDKYQHIKLLLKHLPDLISVSNSLLGRLDDDPSAYGVAVAFISLEMELHSTFLNWSKVYPLIIDSITHYKLSREQKEKRNKRGKSMSFVETSTGNSNSRSNINSPHLQVNKNDIYNNKKLRVKTEPSRHEKLVKKQQNQIQLQNLKKFDKSITFFEELSSEIQINQRLRLNDVAIMPSQRVMRYVLLLKGELILA